MSTRLDPAAFRSVIASFSPAVQAIALRARELVLAVLPEVYEVVWTQQKNTGYGTGPRKQSEHFCWIAPAKAHVTFGFNYGAELPDPAKLLEGTGKAFRHVKLTSLDDAAKPALRKLVQVATKHRVPAPTPLGAPTTATKKTAPAKAAKVAKPPPAKKKTAKKR